MSYSVFSLTAMTGKRAADLRTTVVSGVEASWKDFTVLIAGLLVGIVLMALLWPALHQNGVIAIPVSVAAFYILFRVRSRTGLKQNIFLTLKDGRAARALTNEIVLCGRVVNIDKEPPLLIAQNTLPCPGGVIEFQKRHPRHPGWMFEETPVAHDHQPDHDDLFVSTS
jgi:hypothetical protein